MNALVLQNVSLRIGEQRLFAPIDLRVEAGSVVSVTGPNGSGKSSLLAFLCGTLPPAFAAQGKVSVGAEDVTGLPPEQRGLGILFQDPLLFPHLSVRGNLLFGLRRRGTRRERRCLAEAELASVGLPGFGDRDPGTLSGGQRARVALLRVLLSEPRALLLDEPFSALDATSRSRIRRLVFEEVRRRKLPALLVTHDRDDAEDAGGPVIALADPSCPDSA